MDQLQSQRGNPSEFESEIGAMDRISELPEFIVHHILSFLKTSFDTPLYVELVRMSVLSKKWFHLTASFPVLVFLNNGFLSRESFFKYIDYATSRFCHQNLTAHKFQLITTLQEPAELHIVSQCLELVLKKGVKELMVKIYISGDRLPVSVVPMPNRLFSVASVLESLNISGCELPSSLMVDAVKFKSLIHLNFYEVPVNDEVITYLTTSCPLLKDLKIHLCHGFKRFCVYGHQNLEKVTIGYNTPVERIDIDAPNLFYLSITDRDKRGAPRMNLASCKKLTTVYYKGHPLPNDFLSNFPFIENLHLVTKCNNLKLSSHSLRTLVLDSECDLEDIEFRTPNLVLFLSACKVNAYWLTLKDKCWPLLRDSTILKGCMHYYPDLYIDALCFQKLRRFLDINNGFKVLNLHIDGSYSQKFTESEELKAIELPPYELEHVELQLDTREGSSPDIAFVDAVLWCCRPRSLTFRSFSNSTDFEEQSDLVKFTYKRLVEQEDQGHTKVQIMGPFFSEAQKHLKNLKSSSTALPPERFAIIFIKEQDEA